MMSAVPVCFVVIGFIFILFVYFSPRFNVVLGIGGWNGGGGGMVEGAGIGYGYLGSSTK